MTIRDFINEDYNEFMIMCSDFYSGDAVDHQVDSSHFTKTFKEILAGNNFLRGLIVEYNNMCAGYAQLSFSWSNEAGGLVIWLEELYIKPQFRNLKLGSQLIEYIRNEYKSKAARFRLEVSDANKQAMELYTRLGFQPLNYRQMIIDKSV